MESDIVWCWLRKDPVRWISGALAGLIAGGTATLFAMWIAHSNHFEVWFPVKLIATLFLGPSSTVYGLNWTSIGVGFAAIESLSLLLGVLYAHFTVTNDLLKLFPMGLAWGVASWIFIWNLYLPSVHSIYASQISSAPTFFIFLVFGVSLALVSFFDRCLRRSPKKS